MYRDEIIEGVWRIRDEYAKRHHYNLDEIVEDLRLRQKTPHSKLVDRRKSGSRPIGSPDDAADGKPRP